MAVNKVELADGTVLMDTSGVNVTPETLGLGARALNAQGEMVDGILYPKDGVTPHIGVNGNWFIGEEDTGVKAEGRDGKTPARGTDYWTTADKQAIMDEIAATYPVVHSGTSAPASSLGKNGDLYLRVY